MLIKLTKRVDGSFRIGDYRSTHFATGLTYGEDEIVAEIDIDIPEAYFTEYALAYEDKDGIGCPIEDHPKVRAAIRRL